VDTLVTSAMSPASPSCAPTRTSPPSLNRTSRTIFRLKFRVESARFLRTFRWLCLSVFAALHRFVYYSLFCQLLRHFLNLQIYPPISGGAKDGWLVGCF
jgi:hypothetical protein